ncbi:hypothetical protein EVAR_95846_1 [Eumeta japonica]|uniref:Uncharacterized protein n=1 Tax=Eumeta variegata TaxID=151549 RepID=A0A4C1VNP4_EUMVA|nr:hypothetical protein EVAR_95846_1 [Eumeta japonica]
MPNVCAKASVVRTSLSQLMSNLGGPKQSRRMLLSSIITLVLTYGISIWTDTLRTQESRRQVTSIYWLSALRMASAFRTMSEETAYVIAGMLPIVTLAEERQAELRTEERQPSIRRWQTQSDAAKNGKVDISSYTTDKYLAE